jgi:hypothetical protein
MKKWSEEVNRFKEQNCKFAVVTANNHYAGFSPATANSFREMMALKKQSMKK